MISVEKLKELVGQRDESSRYISNVLYFESPMDRIVAMYDGYTISDEFQIMIWDSENGELEKMFVLSDNPSILLKWERNTFVVVGNTLDNLNFFQIEYSISPPYELINQKKFSVKTQVNIPLKKFNKDLYYSLQWSSSSEDSEESRVCLCSRKTGEVTFNLGTFPNEVHNKHIIHSKLHQNSVIYYFWKDKLRVRNYESNENLVFEDTIEKSGLFEIKIACIELYVSKFQEEIVIISGSTSFLNPNDQKYRIFLFNTGRSFEELKEKLKDREKKQSNRFSSFFRSIKCDSLLSLSAMLIQDNYLFIGGFEFRIYNLEHFTNLFFQENEDEEDKNKMHEFVVDLPPVYNHQQLVKKNDSNVALQIKFMRMMYTTGTESCTFLIYATSDKLNVWQAKGLQLKSSENILVQEDAKERLSYLLNSSNISDDDDVVVIHYNKERKRLVLDLKLQNCTLCSVWKLFFLL